MVYSPLKSSHRVRDASGGHCSYGGICAAAEAPVQRLADQVSGKLKLYGVMAASAATFTFWSTVGTKLFPGVLATAATASNAPHLDRSSDDCFSFGCRIHVRSWIGNSDSGAGGNSAGCPPWVAHSVVETFLERRIIWTPSSLIRLVQLYQEASFEGSASHGRVQRN